MYTVHTKYPCCFVQSPLLVGLPSKRKRCGTREVWTGEVWNRGSVEQGKCGTSCKSVKLWDRLRRWYITIPSLDRWCTTIENHRYQWLSYLKTIRKPLIPMVALNHSIQW